MSKKLKQAVREAMSEFFDRETMDSFKAQGFKDPSDEYSINYEEVKAQCQAFLEKVKAFDQELVKFDTYINNVPDDEDGDQTAPSGVRMTMKHRNMFGARNLDDEFIEQDLDNIDEELHRVHLGFMGLIDALETMY
jgi:hypothetical protein